MASPGTRKSPIEDLAYLTADVPGTGGRIKQRPEDFVVEELPLYAPCGQGEHLHLFIEKRQRSTTDVVHRLAKLFNVRRSDVGYAGLKDKHAVTRQHFSVRLPEAAREARGLERIAFTGLELLWHRRHTHKLRRGHLAGNRFLVRIRGVEPASLAQAQAVLQRLQRQGVPNFIGEQRFGYRRNNHLVGRHLLLGQSQAALDLMLGRADDLDSPRTRAARQAFERGDCQAALEHWPRKLHAERHVLDLLRQGRSPQEALAGMEAAQREFLLNALQSAVFNIVLDRRLRRGALHRLIEGDLAYKHANGAVFAVDADTAALENAPSGRVASLEISPSGPMWGPGMIQPAGKVLRCEEEALAALELSPPDFERPLDVSLEGLRRPLRAILTSAEAQAGGDEHGPFIRLAFNLPPGAYATIVLREIIKPAPGDALDLDGPAF